MNYESFSEEQTESIAYKLAKQALPKTVYCLSGDLGAGKTVFARGFARGLGISEHITSPTFTIINEYYGKMPLYHFDVYRIKSVAEMEDTGYDEFFYGDGVCIVEWADLIQNLIPENSFSVEITKNYEKGDNYRLIKLGAYFK